MFHNNFTIDGSYNRDLHDTNTTYWVAQVKHNTTYEYLKVTKNYEAKVKKEEPK